MNSKNKGLAEISFKDLSDSLSESDEIMIGARLMMYRFLSEIDKITSERGINRKELAKLAGTSASYITQLYQGKKIINLQMLTRIKKALDIDFKIKVVSAEQKSKSECIELKPQNAVDVFQKSSGNARISGAHAPAGLIRKASARTSH